MPDRTRIADAAEIDRMVRRMAHQVAERNHGLSGVALVGIHTRGVPLARRLAAALEPLGNGGVPLGTLDITFYRDDFQAAGFDPEVRDTELPFDVTGMRVVLVDDVLHTGRTIRAAIDEIIDFGRPAEVQLAVLVDRGGRQLPIAPTYVGMEIPTRGDETVRVELSESDGHEDAIWVVKR